MLAGYGALMAGLRVLVPQRLPRARVLGAEYELRHYHEHVEAYQDWRNSVEGLGLGHRLTDDDTPPLPRHGYSHADSTARAVMALVSSRGIQADHLYRSICAVRDTLADCTEAQRRLVALLYWHERGIARAATELGVSLSTAYTWRSRVLAAVAVRLGWA